MPLAILVNFIGERLQPPIFRINNLAAIVGKNGAKMFQQSFRLRDGNILPRNKSVFIECHESVILIFNGLQNMGQFMLPRPYTSGLVYLYLAKACAL